MREAHIEKQKVKDAKGKYIVDDQEDINKYKILETLQHI